MKIHEAAIRGGRQVNPVIGGLMKDPENETVNELFGFFDQRLYRSEKNGHFSIDIEC